MLRKVSPALVFSLVCLVGASSMHCATADASPPCSPPPVAPRDTSPRVEIVGDGLFTLPTFTQSGRRYVLGDSGQRYRVRIVNPTSERLEAVVSIDGLDAVDGKPASVGKRGYVVPAYGDVVIDGWRTSLDSAAAFRFSSVRDSYASRTGHGRNVGVIGVAFYRERPLPRPMVAPRANSAPEVDDEAPAGASAGARAEAAPAPRAAPAPSPVADSAQKAEASRPGLGTQFGEAVDSHVEETAFVRASTAPWLVTEVRYDDREGLVSRGIAVPPAPRPWSPHDDENARRDTAQPFAESRFAQPPPSRD